MIDDAATPAPAGAIDVVEWLSRVAPDLVDDHRQLKRLMQLLDDYHREMWHRHVAVGDVIIDRWDRARRLGFGEGSSVYDSALVLGDVRVGRDTWIGPGTILDGSGGLTIGDACAVSAGVQIYSHDTVLRTVTGGRANTESATTSIGSNTYLGPYAVISKGVAIGRRCVIGAASLVLTDIADGSIAFGTPARVIETTDAYLGRRGLAG